MVVSRMSASYRRPSPPAETEDRKPSTSRRFAARVLDLPPVLLEQPRRLVAVALRAVDRLLERALPVLDRLEDRGEGEAPQQIEEDEEDDERPEHQIDLE